MEDILSKEDILKENIFKKYLELKDENASDKQKYALQLRDLILRWSKIYFYKDATYVYWKEITDTIFRITNQDKEKFLNCHDFTKYLKVCLYHAKAEYYRSEEKKLINISKGYKQKTKQILDIITRHECEIQSQLSEYDKVKYAAEWYNISEKKVRYYLDNYNLFIENNTSLNEDLLNDHNNYNKETPEEIIISKQIELENKTKIHEAFKSVLENRYEITKPLICALFTAQCLKENTGLDWLIEKFDWINEYLDNDTVNYYKIHGKPPSNKDIYLNLYPNAKRIYPLEYLQASKFQDK